MKKINIKRNNHSSRLMSIDYLKAIAIVLVIVNHSLTDIKRLKLGGPFWISMAVPIFMIISGFTYSMSSERRSINTFGQYFNRDLMKTRLSRLIIPYLIIFILELLFIFIVTIKFPSINIDIKLPISLLFLSGGIGPGSYYFPIVIQLLFLFPFMLFFFKKSNIGSIVFFFLAQLSFDILLNLIPIPGRLYRLLIFRYLVFIIMGINLYYNKDKIKNNIALMVLPLSSIIYIWIVNYSAYTPKLFVKWTGTSLPTVFLALAFVVLAMKYLEIENKNKFTHLISLVGKASYHIFLVQKTAFGFGLNRFFRNRDISFTVSSISAILICCSIGFAFYCFEGKVRKSITRIKKLIV